MDYRIIKATPETGQIEVTYTNQGVDVATYAIDIPVVDGAFLTGEALDTEIRHRSPTWLITREEEVATATGFEDIMALVTPLPKNEPDPDAAANAAMWEQVELEKKIAKALVKFGVLNEDPTTIDVTKL